MTESVYLESSIISYLTARPSADVVVAARQVLTANWWLSTGKAFDLFVSALVIEEISKGDSEAAQLRLNAVADIPLLATSSDALAISETLLVHGAVPQSSEEDALHIGIAAASGMDYLLTWNFKHINNAQTKARIADAIDVLGFACPMLCSPEELGLEP
jgi:hypothetical protein